MKMSLRNVGLIGKYLSIGGLVLFVLSALWFTGKTFDKLSEEASSEIAAEISSLLNRDLLVSETLIGISIAGLAVWATASGLLMYNKWKNQEEA